MIELSGVSKTYPSAGRGLTALQGIDLRFGCGEYAAIVGRSGSGKTTLLNMLTGIDHPSSGRVLINDTDVHALGESALARWRGRNVGIVFQFFQLMPTLTVIENVLLAMDLVQVVAKGQRRARAEHLLEQVGIGRHADKLPAALSGGEQQRAAIARALANDPPILVADEPCGNLDSHSAEAIQQLFQDLVAGGKTVIVVTHDRGAVARCGRVVMLKDGEIESDLAGSGVAP